MNLSCYSLPLTSNWSSCSLKKILLHLFGLFSREGWMGWKGCWIIRWSKTHCSLGISSWLTPGWFVNGLFSPPFIHVWIWSKFCSVGSGLDFPSSPLLQQFQPNQSPSSSSRVSSLSPAHSTVSSLQVFFPVYNSCFLCHSSLPYVLCLCLHLYNTLSLSLSLSISI